MFHPKKASTMNSQDSPTMCVHGDSGLVLTTDPKPRLRWTLELHERFIDAVAQLGGPDKATPKTIMRVMGVKGLTLYHLKSHLQKFRLGKQPHKEFIDQSIKDASALELQRNTGSSSVIMARTINERQMEVHRRLYEQLEVQRRLQMRIEAQGKYMQSIMEKACQTLGGENMVSGSYKGIGNQGVSDTSAGAMKDFGSSPLNFPSLQDLNMYGDGLQHNMDRSSSIDHGFIAINDDDICLEKKRPSPYSSDHSGKSPLIWSDHLRLQELGTASSSCLSSQDDPFKVDRQIQIAPPSMDRCPDDMDSMSDNIYETKPMILTGDAYIGEKKFDGSAKLEKHSDRINHMINSTGAMPQGRNSLFG